MKASSIQIAFVIVLLVAGLYTIYQAQSSDEIYVAPEPPKIEISNEIPTLECPEIDTKNQQWKDLAILIDPGHGITENDIGFTLGSLTESARSGKVANLLSLRSENLVLSRSNHEIKPYSARIKKASIEGAEMLISIHSSDQTNQLRAIINKNLKSEKLACLIINHLMQHPDIEFTSRSIVQVNPFHFADDEPEFLLRTDKPAIIIELGSLEKNEDFEMAKTIFGAIEQYHE